MPRRRQIAERRLQKDLQEFADRSWELPTVSALPLEDNMLEWHCNILGRDEYDGVVLHVKLLFPESYPHQPPEVILCSKVHHPHVFGDHLCLDMLEEGQWADAQERDAEFTGWSTCYSVFSILMQLQAFLFDLGNNAPKTKKSAEAFSCFCGHGFHRVYPPFPEPLPPPPRPPVADNPFAHEDDVGEECNTLNEVCVCIRRVDRWGAHVELKDGRTGFLQREEIPRGRWLEKGELVTCWIKSQDPNLLLTLFRTQDQLAQLAKVGLRVPATITGIKPFGLFLDLGGFTGLLHRSETDLLPQQPFPWNTGERVSVRILGEPSSKISLSSKALYLCPSRLRQIIDGDVDLERLRCFHSKDVLCEAVLGVGVSLEEEEAGAANGQKKYHLSSIYDVLSQHSFGDGVRKGVWKQKFSLFLPLAFDEDHFARAKRHLEVCLAKMASGKVAEKTRSHGKSKADKADEYRARMTLDEYRSGGANVLQKVIPKSLGRPEDSEFAPQMVMEVIPKLMNSQVVMLTNGQLWRSQKALEGYFAYHHLLLHCLRAYPKLRTSMEAKLESFLKDPDARVKERVPNLGEFLCYISVSDVYCWEDLGIQILEEAFDRNVLWILKQAPQLGDLSDCGVSAARLRRSFTANRVSLRLLMFQVAFLQLAKPPHTHESGDNPCRAASCALQRKDRCKGLPGPGEAEWLFNRCVEILAVEDFHEFLNLVGAAPMEDAEICRWLRRSVLRSISKNYHNSGYFASLAQKARSPQKEAADGNVDPEDFGLDTRAKESKSAKRRRARELYAQGQVFASKMEEERRALNAVRFSGRWWEVRQTPVFICSKDYLTKLLLALDEKSEELTCSFMSAKRGFKLLDGLTKSGLEKLNFKSPRTIWMGTGCSECGKLITCEPCGLCLPCCRRIAKEPKEARPIKGLTGPDAPTAQFTLFSAEAVMPVVWELHLQVGFDGLTANLDPLRSCLSDDLMVTGKIQGGAVFSRVKRADKYIWESSPEQVIFPGSKLLSGWKGVTDSIYSIKIRNMRFTLLEDQISNIENSADLENLRMTRATCNAHFLEVVTFSIAVENVDFEKLSTRGAPSSLKDAIKDKLQHIVQIELGSGDDVFAELPKSGAKVQLTVVPRIGNYAAAVQSRLTQLATLSTVVAEGLGCVAGIDVVSKSSIRIPHVGPPKIIAVHKDKIHDVIKVKDTDLLNAMELSMANRVCKNCRGILRVRFVAPKRYAERRAQLESLDAGALTKRGLLCGLTHPTVADILKCEQIIR